MTRVQSLGTGSGGNCFAVTHRDATVLVDAGFTAHDIARRMKAAGLAVESVVALLLTHEHGDHVNGAATFAIRHRVPVYATQGTYKHVPGLRRRGVRFKVLAPDWPAAVGPFRVLPFLVPHDAAEPVGYLIEANGACIGVTTDLGHVSDCVRERWSTADVLVAESNHDVDMLRLGPYPERLKERVLSLEGHLSNAGLGAYLSSRAARRLRHLMLAHLSKVNNDPSLALQNARASLLGSAVDVTVAGQDEPGPIVEV